MNQYPLISVIVPIYNVEQYLNKCISSICAQSYRNLQIVLIDDGSPDKCGEICDDFAIKDNRILVVHQSNKGLAEARNKGIQEATGEYILFVDADDFIYKDMILILYQNLITYNADLAVCQYVRSKSLEFTIEDSTISNNVKVVTGKQMCNLFFGPEFLNTIVVWNKLLKREVFDRYKFEHNICEDEEIMLKILYETDKVALSDAKLYAYIDRPSNLTNQIRKIDYAIDGKSEIVYSNFEYMFEHDEIEMATKLFRMYMSFVIRRLGYLYLYEYNKVEYNKQKRVFKEKYIRYHHLVKIPSIYRFYYFIFFQFDKLTIRLRRSYKKIRAILSR